MTSGFFASPYVNHDTSNFRGIMLRKCLAIVFFVLTALQSMQLNKDFVKIVSLLFRLISLHYNNEHIEKDVMLTIKESGLPSGKFFFY